MKISPANATPFCLNAPTAASLIGEGGFARGVPNLSKLHGLLEIDLRNWISHDK